MVRAPGGIKIGGIEFERPVQENGLMGLDDKHVREANRAHVALPGGGWLNFWGRDQAQPASRQAGDVYDCLVPWSSHPDATLASEFDITRRVGRTAGVTQSMSLDVLDRSYGWRVDHAIEDSVTGEFLDSSAPDSIESDDGQSGLDDYIGELSPCERGDIRSCKCCRCPECGALGIRARKNKTPTYACGNPACDADPFDSPALRPARGSEPNGD